MDSPRVTDSPSPVVILPSARTQFSLPININMTDMNATIPTRSNHPPRIRSVICTRRNSNLQMENLNGGSSAIGHHARLYRQSNLLLSTASIASTGTNNAPSYTHGVAYGSTSTNTNNAVTRPRTRSRKRIHNNINTNTNTNAAPLAATVQIQTTKTQSQPSLLSKRSRSKKARFSDNRKMPPPGRKKAPLSLKSGDDDTLDKKPAAAAAPAMENCCICMGDVEPDDLALINGCDHRFCFGCIEKWSERENKCPLCKVRFTKIDRVNKKRKKGTKNTIKVKDRDQRSDLVPGAALEGLLANLNRNTGSLARIILGGFDLGGGVGFGATISTSGPGGSAARASFASRSARSRSVDFDFDTPRIDFDDSSDEESPMSQFMRAIHGGPGPSGIRMSTTVVRPMSVSARFSTTTTTSRSYARNVHDSTAGNGAENPLEIDDDSVGEVIEID